MDECKRWMDGLFIVCPAYTKLPLAFVLALASLGLWHMALVAVGFLPNLTVDSILLSTA